MLVTNVEGLDARKRGLYKIFFKDNWQFRPEIFDGDIVSLTRPLKTSVIDKLKEYGFDSNLYKTSSGKATRWVIHNFDFFDESDVLQQKLSDDFMWNMTIPIEERAPEFGRQEDQGRTKWKSEYKAVQAGADSPGERRDALRNLLARSGGVPVELVPEGLRVKGRLEDFKQHLQKSQDFEGPKNIILARDHVFPRIIRWGKNAAYSGRQYSLGTTLAEFHARAWSHAEPGNIAVREALVNMDFKEAFIGIGVRPHATNQSKYLAKVEQILKEMGLKPRVVQLKDLGKGKYGKPVVQI